MSSNTFDRTAGPRPPWIMVVDDDATVRTVIARMLAAGGFDVRHAEHGRAALDQLSSLVTDDVPAALIIDHEMPVMDGPALRFELARSEELRRIPQLLMSGRDLWNGPDLQHDCILRKPFKPDALLLAVTNLLEP